MNKIKKLTFKWLIACIMVLSCMATVVPQRAQAQWTDFANLVPNVLSSVYTVYTDVSTNYLSIKETVLDPLAWMLAKQLIQTLTGDIVNWINSGFEGSPAFLTNPGGFFLDSADQLTGQFLSKNGDLSQLCSPFSLDLRLNLALNSSNRMRKRYTCTLGKIIQNSKNAIATAGQNSGITISSDPDGATIGNFISGDFRQGGWDAYIAYSIEPQNNPFGSYLLAQDDLQNRIAEKNEQTNLDLNRGQGFLSWQKCTDVTANFEQSGGGSAGLGLTGLQESQLRSSNDTTVITGTDQHDKPTSVKVTLSPEGEAIYEQCSTQTPGSVISSSLNKQLGTGNDSLVAADEIDEILGALFSQLVKTVLTGGLNAASQRGSGATQSVIDSIRAEQGGSLQGIVTNITNEIHKYLPDAIEYKSVRDQTVTVVQNLKSSADTRIALCQSTNHTTYVSDIQNIITTQITPLLTQNQALATQAATQLQTLRDIQTSLNTPPQDAQKINALSAQFSQILSTRAIITPIDINHAKDDLAAVTSTSTTIQNSLVQYDNLCRVVSNGI